MKLERLKAVGSQLRHRYSHRSFISILIGLYSCQWRRAQGARARPGVCCCKKNECLFLPIVLAAFSLSLFFLYSWAQAKNDYNNFDWFTYTKVGRWFFWSLALLVLASVMVTYLSGLVILAVCLLSEGQQLYLHRGHKMVIVVLLGVSLAWIVVICKLWKENWITTLLSLQVTAPYLHLGAIAVMVFLSWPVALHYTRLKNRGSQLVLLIPFLALLFFLYLVPLGVSSPCIQPRGALGPRPALIGHRGAPMLAPENTKMAFEKAIDHGAEGLETDVTISYDGVPYLMHDHTLRRTTNVQQVHPNKSNVHSSMFSWSELEVLNAGRWFLRDKPYVDMGSLSGADRAQAANQSVFKFSDFLRLADRANKLVIFDLYRPPNPHPYTSSWISRALDAIVNESRIKPHLVLWLPDAQRSNVQQTAPGFQHVTRHQASVPDLLRNNITGLNLPYTDMARDTIQMYAAANITTNVYVVSEPWLFSLAWCAGAHSVTTNTVHHLKALHRPLFLMTPEEYRHMWILTDVLSAALILLVFAFHSWRERSLVFCTEEQCLGVSNTSSSSSSSILEGNSRTRVAPLACSSTSSFEVSQTAPSSKS
ncbi:glycerophosphodiester phosphodiesterase domain-containing protein 4 [Tachyglossus aculeatus]|uniref:glycerophosphodiester phosphodiesterase domain-containing protein 4 n=1 Tax=Tachyglossus aculeatus TaxID=9261 RepID=UPI0018F458AC|nr:glycerophosphodiester phosphodiesterase domain-containing protein 4 [Tachyglossus aculeatus]